jgi:hypothetical protein
LRAAARIPAKITIAFGEKPQISRLGFELLIAVGKAKNMPVGGDRIWFNPHRRYASSSPSGRIEARAIGWCG